MTVKGLTEAQIILQVAAELIWVLDDVYRIGYRRGKLAESAQMDDDETDRREEIATVLRKASDGIRRGL